MKKKAFLNNVFSIINNNIISTFVQEQIVNNFDVKILTFALINIFIMLTVDNKMIDNLYLILSKLLILYYCGLCYER
jgi:hypothetical protein